MRSIAFLFASFFVGAATLQADVKVIQAFEGDGFDSWQTTGTAFGLAPVAGKVTGVNGEFRNYGGNALVVSGHGGDAATGTLTSPDILLTHPFPGSLSLAEIILARRRCSCSSTARLSAKPSARTD